MSKATKVTAMNHQQRLANVLTHYGIAPALVNNAFEDLDVHYRESHRHYHHWTHIKTMLSMLSEMTKLSMSSSQAQSNDVLTDTGVIHDPDALTLAIYYHDVIYDPTRTDNEAMSAQLFRDTWSAYLPDKLVQRVCTLIEATQAHQLTDINDTDMAYFLDMDLAILGSEPSAYQNYANAIRQEYAHVPDVLYRLGRKAVLEKFLAREKLYFSSMFFGKYERQARNNIEIEILFLSEK